MAVARRHSRYAAIVQQTLSADLRTRYDVILPGEILHEIAQQTTCVDDYYVDADGQRLYAVARERKGQEPSSAETDGLLKLRGPQALLNYGAFCLFMAADRSVGYRLEKDLRRFAAGSAALPAETKLLWTVDDEGAHFVPESLPWDSMRGMPSHTSISDQAYFGGEAWRTGENELTINGASRAFGYNRDFPASLMAEGEKRYETASKFLRAMKLAVTARPLGTR